MHLLSRFEAKVIMKYQIPALPTKHDVFAIGRTENHEYIAK